MNGARRRGIPSGVRFCLLFQVFRPQGGAER